MGAGAIVMEVLVVAVAPALSVTASCNVTLPAAKALSVTLEVLLAPAKLALDAPETMVH